jgi:hypothetical protein
MDDPVVPSVLVRSGLLKVAAKALVKGSYDWGDRDAGREGGRGDGVAQWPVLLPNGALCPRRETTPAPTTPESTISDLLVDRVAGGGSMREPRSLRLKSQVPKQGSLGTPACLQMDTCLSDMHCQKNIIGAEWSVSLRRKLDS